MGIYTNILLYCNICKAEGYESTYAFDSRKRAKKRGWKRKMINGVWGDICPKCQRKVNHD